MGQSTFPVPSSGSSTSTVLPVNASSVILDGSLTSATSYTTTINGNGGIAYLTATDNPATFTIGSKSYTVSANSTVATTSVVGSSVSATIAANYATTAPTAFTANTMSFSPGNGWSGLAYGNGLWIACGGNNTSYSSSSNGVSWATGTFPLAMSNIGYGNGYWAATGGFVNNSANSLYSTNGTTWTAGSGLSSRSWRGIIYGGDKFLIMTGNFSSSTCAYSNDGITWQSMTMPSTQTWYGVAYGLIGAIGYYMAVAASGSNVSAYSTNGTTWTATTLGTTGTWIGVAYGNGTFVATANATNFQTSTDGITWTNQSTVATGSGVSYGNGYFINPGTGPSSSGFYSTNGITWTTFTLTASFSWSLSAWGGGTYVALKGSSPGGTVGNYFTQATLMPVNFGIYNGPTTIN